MSRLKNLAVHAAWMLIAASIVLSVQADAFADCASGSCGIVRRASVGAVKKVGSGVRGVFRFAIRGRR